MTFSQALARIEDLVTTLETCPEYHWQQNYNNLRDTLAQHADSIVQLGKVAAEMRAECTGYADYLGTRRKAADAYDRLMKGEE